jgi:hypothetical protein
MISKEPRDMKPLAGRYTSIGEKVLKLGPQQAKNIMSDYWKNLNQESV